MSGESIGQRNLFKKLITREIVESEQFSAKYMHSELDYTTTNACLCINY